MSKTIKDKKLLYHLTAINSFESIVQFGLMSRDALIENNITFLDTADQNILKERERLNLSQFIPFHFHIHTAYDTAVKDSNIFTVFIYLCLRRSYAIENDFKILPIHPVSTERPIIYDYEDGFNMIDWKTMELTQKELFNMGASDVDINYHKQVRMAECLSPCVIPISDFQSIHVKDQRCKNEICYILNYYNVNPQPFVDISEKMF